MTNGGEKLPPDQFGPGVNGWDIVRRDVLKHGTYTGVGVRHSFLVGPRSDLVWPQPKTYFYFRRCLSFKFVLLVGSTYSTYRF
jgi:hypothetical protein